MLIPSNSLNPWNREKRWATDTHIWLKAWLQQLMQFVSGISCFKSVLNSCSSQRQPLSYLKTAMILPLNTLFLQANMLNTTFSFSPYYIMAIHRQEGCNQKIPKCSMDHYYFRHRMIISRASSGIWKATWVRKMEHCFICLTARPLLEANKRFLSTFSETCFTSFANILEFIGVFQPFFSLLGYQLNYISLNLLASHSAMQQQKVQE